MSIKYLVDDSEISNYLYKDSNKISVSAEQRYDIYKEAAALRISAYLGYNILSTAYVDEPYLGTGNKILFLSNRPITVLTSVKENSIEIDLPAVIDARVLLRSDANFALDTLYTISYTAGYTRKSMPADIRLAALRLIALSVKKEGANIEGVTSKTTETNSESYDFKTAEDIILSSIAHYRSFI